MRRDPDWLPVAQGLKVGGSAKVAHDCGDGRPLVVFNNDTAWSAYCHRCGNQPPVFKPTPTLAEKRAAMSAQAHAEAATESDRRPPQPAVFDTAEWPLEARVWLFKAGLSHSEVAELGAYYHPPTRRVVLPVVENGCVSFWQARRIFGTAGAKYLSMPGGRETALPLFSAPASPVWVLTEDLLSAFKIYTSGFTGLCLMGTSLLAHTASAIMSSGMPIGIWLDPDRAGQNAAGEVQRRLSLLGVPSFNIVSQRDPKLHSKAEIHGIITRHLAVANDEVAQGLRQAGAGSELAELG